MSKEFETTKLLTVDQVAELTGWSKSTIRSRIWRRKLEFIRLDGRSIRFRRQAIDDLIERGTVPALPDRK